MFDKHFAGPPANRVCADPATATDKNGKPLFSARPGRDGVTWVGYSDEPWTGPDE